MVLTISCLFSEPGFKFHISYKVDNFIRDKLRILMHTYKLDEKDKDLFLGLVVSTNSKTKKVEVKGPDVDKKNKFINWGLWLPYEDIVNTNNQLVPYLKYIFEAMVIVFGKYDVKEEDVKEIQKIVENEVVNNPEYIYSEEETKPLDLSKIKFK